MSFLPDFYKQAELRIVGIGQDYIAVSFRGMCPCCCGTDGLDRLKEVLGQTNVVFLVSEPMGYGFRKAEKHVWLNKEASEMLFPTIITEAASRGNKVLRLGTLEEMSEAYKEKRPVVTYE